MNSKSIAIGLATVDLSIAASGKTLFFAAGLLLTTTWSCTSANAASLTIPTTIVNATSISSGPSFTVNGNFLGTDTISINVTGKVNLDTNVSLGYYTNAAGIFTQTASTGLPNNTPGSANVGPLGFNYGALLLGNNTLGFKLLFPSVAANGLGSSNPPTNLSLNNVTLASIFGSGLADGTVLEFRINDIPPNSNNSGAFTVNSPTSVPEPFTIIGTIIGGTAALRLRKKLKSEPDNRA